MNLANLGDDYRKMKQRRASRKGVRNGSSRWGLGQWPGASLSPKTMAVVDRALAGWEEIDQWKRRKR